MSPAQAAVRRALGSGDFAEARRSWDQYAGELRLAILSGEATADDLREAAGLLESARLSAAAFRAHAAARLEEAWAASAYAQPGTEQRRTRALL